MLVLNRLVPGDWRDVKPQDAKIFDPSLWLVNPSLPFKAPHPSHWMVEPGTDNVILRPSEDIETDDAARSINRRDAIADRFDREQSLMRALAMTLLDELNNRADDFNALRDSILDASSLADVKAAGGAIQPRQTRTAQQLKAAIRARLDN